MTCTGCGSPATPTDLSNQACATGVVVQSDEFDLLSTCIVAPTSTSARPASFRPEVEIDGRRTRVLIEQARAVDRSRLGEPVGHLGSDELRSVDDALRLMLAL